MINKFNTGLESVINFSSTREAQWTYISQDKKNSIVSQWECLSQTKKNYVRYLVVRFGYPVAMAVQSAHFFGFQKWQYDYRNNCPVEDDTNPDIFGTW